MGDATFVSEIDAVLSVNVHVVTRPDSMATPVMPLPLAVPVEPLPSSTHETESRCQPTGTVSVTDAASVTTTPIAGVSPLPVIEWMLPAGGGVTVNEKLVKSSGFASFSMTRNPLPGFTMQSNGLLLPPLPAEGYAHTFTRAAPDGKMSLLMTTPSVESSG